MNGKELLIKELQSRGIIKNKKFIEALKNISREDFFPAESKEYAYYDDAFPIGYGQTISQPYTVFFMLNLLDPKEADNIMDVGFGSGWQTTLLAYIVGKRGSVRGIEIVKGVYDFGKSNISKYPELSKRIKLYCQNATNGLPEEAEKIAGFDGIIAAAEVQETPNEWRKQLKIGGRLVYPKDNSIHKETKKSESGFVKEVYPGFVFVPFIEPGS